MRYLYIFGTLFFTVYGQLILKWRLSGLKFVLPKGGISATCRKKVLSNFDVKMVSEKYVELYKGLGV